MLFVDTGYFIALFDESDALHARASAWADQLQDRLLVTEYVLLELVNHFSKPQQRSLAHAILDLVREPDDYEVVPSDARLFAAGVALHRSRSDQNWSLTDCISFVVMTEKRVSKALAYDRHFAQAGFEALLRRDP